MKETKFSCPHCHQSIDGVSPRTGSTVLRLAVRGLVGAALLAVAIVAIVQRERVHGMEGQLAAVLHERDTLAEELQGFKQAQSDKKNPSQSYPTSWGPYYGAPASVYRGPGM